MPTALVTVVRYYISLTFFDSPKSMLGFFLHEVVTTVLLILILCTFCHLVEPIKFNSMFRKDPAGLKFYTVKEKTA